MKKLIVAASCALAMMTGTAQAQEKTIALVQINSTLLKC